MGKQATSFELALGPPAGARHKSSWLYAALKAAVMERRLPAGTRIPATRAVAQSFGIARGTVVKVFELLAAEGLVRSEIGSGTWVAPLREPARPVGVGPAGNASASAETGRLSRRSTALLQFRFAAPARVMDTTLFPFYPAFDLFPFTAWQKIASRRMRSLDAAAMQNQQPLGYLPLREAIADYVRLSRGISCTAQRVAVVSGVQQALDIVARLVADPGDTAVIEDPCYPGAAAVLAGAGLRLMPLGVDVQGLPVPKARHGAARIRLAFVTPAHQAPLGMIMSAQRRIDLLAWAGRNGAVIFEDDYDSEFRYSGWPVPALGASEHAGRVITFGSFTKTLYPSLRIGYVVLPQWLVEPFAGAMSVTSRYAEPTLQHILFDFMVQGHYARHIQRMRGRYAERRQLLNRELESKLSSFIRPDAAGEGLATIAWLKKLSAAQVCSAGQDHQIALVPLSRYVLKHSRPEALVLGFANASPATLPATLGRLKKSLQQAASG